jgi:acetoin utilization deacetylase AcuC-like enzyme
MPLRASSPPPPRSLPPDAPRAFLVDDPHFDAHASGAYHPERPERLVAARAAAAKARVAWELVPAREATDEELTRVHDPAYIAVLEKLRGARTHLDADTFIAPGSVQAARIAAGSLVAMVDRILDAPAQSAPARGVALLRPPGHHARPAQAMGFCLVNNIAVAAAHAISRGLERVLILDWDVHHGNGTQEMFLRDPRVLFMSTHQWPFYPGTGAARDRGEGAGEGFTVNVPMTAHGGDGVYASAFEQVLLPIAEAYAPELVLVSAGFDAATRDPLAQMEVSSDGFAWMARAVTAIANKSAQGRIALVLEGGYDLVALEAGLERAIEGIAGIPSIAAPGAELPRDPDNADVARARRAASRAWKKAVG